jgi:hypothetical protein
MSETNDDQHISERDLLHEVIARLKERRDHLARVQRHRAVLTGAYDLVLSDIDSVEAPLE